MAGNKDEEVKLVVSALVDGLENVAKLTGELKDLEKAGQEKIPDNTKPLREGADKTTGVLGRLWQRLTGFFSTAKKSSNETGRLADGLNNSSKAAGAAEKTIGGVTRRLVAMAAAYLSVRSLTGFFTGAVREAGDLEQQLATVQAVTKATAEEMDALKAAATDMGARTSYTAVQAGEAMEALARAGLSTRETLQALPEVLSLARGNSIELAEAASLITQSISGMGGSFEESAKYADILTRAAQRANTDVTGLGQALSYAAPTARSLGLEVELTTALIGKLADSGIGASRAGTALNSIFSQFQNPASAFRRELDQIGITTTDFGQALEQLEASGQKGQSAIIAVGQEAGPALRALLAQGTAGLRELEAELKNSGGAAQEAAAIMDDTLPGALERLSSAWSTLKRALGDKVLEPAKNAVDELAAGILNLVSGGKIEELGQKFRATFEQMVGQVRTFLREFDIDAAMDKAGQAMASLGVIARNTGNALTVVGQSINAVWQGVNFVVGGAMTTIAKSAAGLGMIANLMVQGLHKVGLVSKEAAASFEMHTEAFNSMADAMMMHSIESLGNAGKAVVKVGDAIGDLTTETDRQTESQHRHAQATEETTVALVEQSGVAENLAEALNDASEEVDDQSALVRELRQEYEHLKASGTATPQELGQALKRLQDAQKPAITSALSLAQAYERLGTTSQSELVATAEQAREAFEVIRASGTASAYDVEQAYLAYARAAKASGDDATMATAKAAGTALGLSDAMKGVGDSAEDADNKMKGLRDTLSNIGNLQDQINNKPPPGEQGYRAAATAADALRSQVEAVRSALGELSDQALAAFDQGFLGRGALTDLDAARAKLGEVSEKISEIQKYSYRLNAGGVGDWMNDMQLAAAQASQAFYQQKVEFLSLVEAVESGGLSLQNLTQLSRTTKDQFDLLDDTDLSRLHSAIDTARQKIESLNESAASTLANLRNELDQMEGDIESVQRRNYDQQRKQLEEQLKAAQESGAKDAAKDLQESLKAAEQLHKAKIKQIKDEEAARRKAQQDEAARARAEAEAQRSQQAKPATTTTTSQRSQSPGQRIVLQAPGGREVEVQTADPNGLLAALESAGLRTAL